MLLVTSDHSAKKQFSDGLQVMTITTPYLIATVTPRIVNLIVVSTCSQDRTRDVHNDGIRVEHRIK